MTPTRPERYYLWIAAAALLAPLLGGQLSLEPQPLAPGGLLTALFREPAGATLAHFLIFLPILGGVLLALGRRAVIQLPHLRTTVIWSIFTIVLLASIAMSGYRFQSAQAFAEWLAYVVALFATVALVGRREGPKWVAAGFSGGCGIVALVAIKEYLFQPDPTWRVIANWLNPNALAALVAMGALVSVGAFSNLAFSNGEPDQGRRENSLIRLLVLLVTGAAGTLTVTTLVLTGSKGGLLAFGLGLLVLVAAGVVWSRSLRVLGPAVVIVGLGVAVSLGLVAVHPKPETGPTASAFARMAGAGTTSEQSAGFRRLLWQTSIDLIKDNPMGRGLGTFKNHSARPGRVTQTQLAHESYLQMGVETGVLGMIVYVVALLLSLGDVLRGSRSLPRETGHLRAGVFGALVSMACHSAIDSDFSHFGLGIAFFVMLGILFQLSADATVPEFSPRGIRLFGAAVACAAAIGLLVFGLVDVRLATLRYAIATRDLPLAQATFDSVSALGSGDPRLWSLASRVAQTPKEMRSRVERSLELGPTPSTYRMLADLLESEGDLIGAERELNASLQMDPNNLFSLRRLLELRKKRDPDTAAEVARRLVAVEDTSYFKIRSLPELVPTETFEARLFLAEKLLGADRASMLRPAAEGYASFAAQTVPQVAMFAKAGLDGGYGGITKEMAMAKLRDGLFAARESGSRDAIETIQASVAALSE